MADEAKKEAKAEPRKTMTLAEKIAANKPVWVKVNSEELKQINPSANGLKDTGDLKVYLLGKVGVKVSRVQRQSMKAVMEQFGVKNAAELKEILAKKQG